MKNITAAILLFAVFASPAFAEGFFVGSSIGFASGYPDKTKEIRNALINAGATYTEVIQKKTGIGAFDVHGGQWINEYFGWEVGNAYLGKVDGTWTSVGSSAGSYEYSAHALHAAALGGIPLGKRNKLYGKVGWYAGSTTENVDYTGSYSQSKTEECANFFAGVGYEMSFSDHFAGNVEFNLFNGMKFYDFAKSTPIEKKTEDRTIIRLAIGLNYKF